MLTKSSLVWFGVLISWNMGDFRKRIKGNIKRGKRRGGNIDCRRTRAPMGGTPYARARQERQAPGRD